MTPEARVSPVLVAAGLGAAGGALAGALWMAPAELAFATLLGGLLAAIAVEDWRHQRIADPANLALLAAGIGAAVVLGETESASDERVLHAVVDAAICGGAFLLLRSGFRAFTAVEGLGLGDVKFAAAAGTWLGLAAFPWFIMLASLLALGYVGAVGLTERGWPRERRIPFGAFLAPALFAAWIILLMGPRLDLPEWARLAGA